MTQPTIPQPRLSPPSTEWDLPPPRRPISGPGPPPLPWWNQVRLKARWERIQEVGAAAPRRQARPFRQGPRPLRAPSITSKRAPTWRSCSNVAAEQQTGEAVPASPLYPGPPSILAGHHAGDRLLSATVLLIITDGRSLRLDWDPAKGPAQQVLLPDLPSAQAEAAYVPDAVLARVTAGIVPLDSGKFAATSRLPLPDLCPAPKGRLDMAAYIGWPPRERLSLPPPRGRFPYGKASDGGQRTIQHRLLLLHGRRLGCIPPCACAT